MLGEVENPDPLPVFVGECVFLGIYVYGGVRMDDVSDFFYESLRSGQSPDFVEIVDRVETKIFSPNVHFDFLSGHLVLFQLIHVLGIAFQQIKDIGEVPDKNIFQFSVTRAGFPLVPVPSDNPVGMLVILGELPSEFGLDFVTGVLRDGQRLGELVFRNVQKSFFLALEKVRPILNQVFIDVHYFRFSRLFTESYAVGSRS